MKSWLYSRIVGNKFVPSEIPSQVSQTVPQYYSKAVSKCVTAVLNHPYFLATFGPSRQNKSARFTNETKIRAFRSVQEGS